MKKLLLISLFTLTCGLLTGCDNDSAHTIVVGASPSPHSEILNCDAFKNYIESKGYKLKIQVYQDYVTPNKALNDKALDANYFQHIPYLNKEVANKGYTLSPACQVHNEPLNLYGKTKIDDFSNKTIYIINDTENIERALILLKSKNIIDSYDISKVGTTAPKESYTSSINVTLQCVDGGLLHNHVDNGNYAVIPGNYALTAWGSEVATNYKVFGESSDVAYPNIIAVRDENLTSEKTNILCEAFALEEVKSFIQNRYGPTVNYCYQDLRK